MKFNTQIRWSCKIFAATRRGVHPSSSQVLTSHLYDIKIMMSLKCSQFLQTKCWIKNTAET